MNVTLLPRQENVRDDGWLAELIWMKYTDHPFCGIHSYIVSICVGRSRANHFHRKKEEWIAPVAVTARLLLEDMVTGERESVLLDSRSQDYGLVFIPPSIAHSVQNTGEEDAVVIVFSRTPEDPEDTLPFRFD